MAKKIFVGMSGGVDSSVSAVLLKKQGYDVTGVYMKNWSNEDWGIEGDCPWKEDISIVKNICSQYKIPFISFNFEKEYREKVMDNFFSEYKAGRTPNPDVLCNKEIKFNLFLKRSLEAGADMIATGHYARIEKKEDTYILKKGIDNQKDQTYFLYTLNQYQLAHTIFPIGHLLKSEVRKKAHEYKLINADKKDSQGICFVGKINVQDFLRKYIKKLKGNIIDIDTNEVIGTHDGIYYYTIGQRAKIPSQPKPYFIVQKDIQKNIIFVGSGKDHPKLFSKSINLTNIHLINSLSTKIIKAKISVRYNHNPKDATITFNNDYSIAKVVLNNPERAITKGQSGVIYHNDICIGGGIIS